MRTGMIRYFDKDETTREAYGFAVRLYRLRKEKHLTRQKLGTLVGLSDRSIVNYENGSRYPNSLDIKKLAMALGTTTSELIGEEICIPGESNRFVSGLKVVTEEIRSAFLSDTLTDEEKDEMMAAVSKAYWDSKKVQDLFYGIIPEEENGIR